LKISGITQETLKWKLFPFSLIESARQWYTSNVRSANRDWNNLRDRFYLAFFPLSRICALQAEILTFHQKENESIGASWVRLSLLAQSGLDLSLPDHLLLQHLYTGLSKEDAHYVDITIGGSFSHKTPAKGREILNKIMENTSFVCKREPPRVEPEVHHEEALASESEYLDPNLGFDS
jgi:hypothetical protein